MKFTRRRIFMGTAALTAAAIAAIGTRLSTTRYYSGPVTDHFDGTRFVGRYAAPAKRASDFWRWQRSYNKTQWPEWVANKEATRPPARVTDNSLRVTYVGHATFLIQIAGLNILTDPIWSERASPFTFAGPKRHRNPGIAFEALPPIDLVLVSHCHYDHLDLATLSRLAATHRPRIITPLGNDTIMRSHDAAIAAEARDWNETIAVNANVAVSLTPARHWSARQLFDRNKALWSAFVIDTPAGKIYFVGDSGYGDGEHFRDVRARHGAIRLAILPIGAYEPRWFMGDQHMNPDESVKAFRDCGAEFALASHFGTFQLTDEAIDAPVIALDDARAAAGISRERFRALDPGEFWIV